MEIPSKSHHQQNSDRKSSNQSFRTMVLVTKWHAGKPKGGNLLSGGAIGVKQHSPLTGE